MPFWQATIVSNFKTSTVHVSLLPFFILKTPIKVCPLANSEDPDEMLKKEAYCQGLHCLQRQKQSSVAEIIKTLFGKFSL